MYLIPASMDIYIDRKNLQMLAFQNGQERTSGQFNELLRNAGWELKEIKRTDNIGTRMPHVIAVPL